MVQGDNLNCWIAAADHRQRNGRLPLLPPFRKSNKSRCATGVAVKKSWGSPSEDKQDTGAWADIFNKWRVPVLPPLPEGGRRTREERRAALAAQQARDKKLDRLAALVESVARKEDASQIEPPTSKRQTAIGRNIKRLKDNHGWTYAQLEVKTGIDKRTILRHVNEGVTPEIHLLKAYADVFSVSVEELKKERRP